jgi:F-type H+-transporting ATPase subunit a
MNGIEGIYPRVVFKIGPFPITDTVTTTWLLMGVLCLFAFWYRHKASLMPRPLQNAFEWLIEAFLGLIKSLSGKEDRRFLPLLLTLGLFITLSNVMEVIPGLHPPTRDLSTPFALAIAVFLAVHYYGLRTWGLGGYLRHYLFPLYLFPIRLIEEFSRTLSLTVRLFGNILGDAVLVAILVLLVPFFLPIPLELFALFTAVIQAFIFCILSLVYLIGATTAQNEGGSS